MNSLGITKKIVILWLTVYNQYYSWEPLLQIQTERFLLNSCTLHEIKEAVEPLCCTVNMLVV
jgi:hypothetical protein